jgi:anti-sigma-K factor RskA
VNDHLDLPDLTADQLAELPLLTDLLADPASWLEPRAGLADDVVAAVRNAGAGPSAVPTAPARRPRRTWLVAAVAAVAALATVGGGAAVVDTQRTPAPLYSAHLAATPLAPDASASVAVAHNRAGFRVHLDASSLPSLHKGQYFQAWLGDGHRTSVPIGTFSSSDDRVTLWSGVSPAELPHLTVTIEAADGVQSSSGRVVLAGDVQRR